MLFKKMEFQSKARYVASCCVLFSASSFADDVTVYGSLRPTFEHVKVDGQKLTEKMDDNSTRFGVKAAFELQPDLKLHLGIEEGYDLSTGEETDYPRNLYVGLSSNTWGSVAIGRLDSSNPTGSPLYSQLSGIVSFAGNDAGLTAVGTSIANARNRTSNAIGYKSPEIEGWLFKARYYNSGHAMFNFTADDPTRSLDLGLDYKNDDFKVALGFAKDWRQADEKANKMDKKWQLGVRSTHFKAFQPYALYGQEYYHQTENSQKDIAYWITGFKLNHDQHSWVLNYMQKDVQRELEAKQQRYQFAYMYKVNKDLTLQAYYDHYDKNDLRDDKVTRGFGLGLKYDFKWMKAFD